MSSFALAASLVAAMFSASSGATTLYSILNSPRLGNPSTNFVGPSTVYANDFITGESSANVLSATLALRNGDDIIHNYTVGIWSDLAGSPDALIDSFPNIPVPSVYAVADYTTTSIGGIVLAPNTTYWLVLSIAENYSDGAPDVMFASTSGSDGGHVFSAVPSTATAESSNGGADWNPGTTYSMAFQLDGTLVPEPNTRSIVGLAGLCLFLMRPILQKKRDRSGR